MDREEQIFASLIGNKHSYKRVDLPVDVTMWDHAKTIGRRLPDGKIRSLKPLTSGRTDWSSSADHHISRLNGETPSRSLYRRMERIRKRGER